MKITLTRREKGLLYLLLFVIILCAGSFGLILPAWDFNQQLQIDKTAANTELELLQAQQVSEKDLETKLAEAQASLVTEKEQFYENYRAEDIDALLTALVIKHGMTPKSMNISDIVEEDLYTYEDYQKISDKESSSTDAKAKQVKVCNVSMQVSGSIAQIQTLIDAANANTSLRVSGVAYSVSDNVDTMTLTFKLYLI